MFKKKGLAGDRIGVAVRKGYDCLSQEYFLVERKIWLETKPWLERIDKGARVLDLGCGEGRILQSIRLDVDYVGIDFSKGLIDLAKKRYGRRSGVKFVLADVTKGKTWENLGKFDVVFAVALIHHLPFRCQQLELLERIKRHFNKNGVFYLSVWNLWRNKFIAEHFDSLRLKFDCLPDSLRWIEIPFRRGGEKRFYTALGQKYLISLLKEAGFDRYKFAWGKNRKNLWMTMVC